MSIDKIPDHFLLSVFKKLDIRDLLHVRLVCRKWATIVSDSSALRRIKRRLVISNKILNDQHPFVQTFMHSQYNIWAWTKIRLHNMGFEESEFVASLCSKIGPHVECLCITFTNPYSYSKKKWLAMPNRHNCIKFLKYTPNLNELKVRSDIDTLTPQLSDSGSDEVISEVNLPKLKKVFLSCNGTCLNAKITKILAKCANGFSFLDFFGKTKMEFDTLYFLIENQRHSLKELKICGLTDEMENSEILQKYFAIDNLSLEVVDLMNFVLDSQSLKLLGNHKNLRELRCDTKINENLQQYPIYLQNLEKLDIDLHSQNDNFPFPKNLNNLKSLKVNMHPDDESESESVLISYETATYCPNLKVLELNSFGCVEISSVSLFSFVDNFPNLRVLKLDNCKCASGIVAAIADNLVHLEELHLDIHVKNPALERNAFSNISNLRKLKQLTVEDYIHICDDRFFLEHLRLPALTDLKMWINSCYGVPPAKDITDQGICGLIDNCPLLRSINLTVLDGVTVDSLYKIRAGLVHLRSLTILGNLITMANCNRINNSLRRRRQL